LPITAEQSVELNLSKLQITLLAHKILENTPEYIHFAEGTKFSWILLPEETKKNPKSIQEEVIKQLKDKYTVYLKKEAIPPELLFKNLSGSLIGYKEGFYFSYVIEFEEKETIKIYYSDWESNKAASSHWKRYKWIDGDWRVIEKSILRVS
jgi:hypothetical protein